MKEKIIESGNLLIKLRTMTRARYLEILREYMSTNDAVKFADDLVFYSIVSWNVKDKDGNILPITREIFHNNVFADITNELQEAAVEVNNLKPIEKKT